jgi:hypothetical protein
MQSGSNSLLYPENEDSRFLQNIGNFVYHMTVYHTPEDRVIVFVTMITLNLIGISNWYSEGD